MGRRSKPVFPRVTIDTVDMLRPMTKWNTRVHDPRMISEAVRKAFSTAAAEKPGAYGLIEMHQRRKFGHVAGTRFDNPDLVGLAHAFGVDGVRVEGAGDLPAILAKALDSSGPVVVDIPIDYAENDKLGIDLWQLAPEALA